MDRIEMVEMVELTEVVAAIQLNFPASFTRTKGSEGSKDFVGGDRYPQSFEMS
ncbi:hypothetical protein [Nostoc sp. CALU 546]|uniref:hypothetical protein n=1 Tax=Nostoc sp. CALU 546 TaxID=1867241 RepID=UPI003B67F563